MRTIRLPNSSISFTRLGTFYLVLFLALAAAAGVVLYSSHTSIRKYNSISTKAVDRLNVLSGIRQEAGAVQLATLRMIFNTERGDVEQEQMNIQDIHDRFRGDWIAYQQDVARSGDREMGSLRHWRQEDSLARARLLKLSDEGAKFNDSAINVYYTLQKPAYERYERSIEAVAQQVKHQIQLDLTDADRFVAESSDLVSSLLLVSFIFMLLGGALLMRHLKKLARVQGQLASERQERRAEITRHTIEAQERERIELGRELHDNVNQLLSAARLTLSVVRDHPEQGDVLIPRSIDCLHRAIEEIRCLSKALVSPISHNISLQVSLEALVTTIGEAAPFIQWTLDIQLAGEDSLAQDLKLAVYRMAQEQLANIVKHARATCGRVEVCLSDSTLLLRVSDNGQGFDTNSRAYGLGLHNITNRAAAYRGSADLVTAPGRGCRWTVSLPVKAGKTNAKPSWLLSKVALW